jgi:hypothetical protein
MTAATQDILTQKMGPEDQVLPNLFNAQVDAATTIYGGTMVMIKSTGYAGPAAASSTGAPGKVVGRCEKQVVNTTAAGYGSAGALQVQYDVGAFLFALNADSTVTIANFGASMYASDDSTVSLSDGGGQRPFAGYFVGLPTTPGQSGSVNASGSSKVFVQLGVANPFATNPELNLVGQYKARAVITTLQAYSGSGTGTLTANTNVAISTQDTNVSTLAVGDVVFLPAGTTNIAAAKDAGPYAIKTLGNGTNTPWVLTRPDWWATGATIPLAATIDIDGEGLLFGGTSWRSFAAKATVIDTTDPSMYPGRVLTKATLVNSIVTMSSIPIYSANAVAIEGMLLSAAGTATSCVGYGLSTTPTAGAIGTATFNIVSLVAGMTKNANNDNSIVGVLVINW